MTLATLRSSAGCLDDEQQTVVEDDESLLDNALENGVFHWILQSFLGSKTLKTEEFYLRRFHHLLTDLIVLMPLKVKELRNRADESARNKLMHEQEGVQFTVPLAGQHFENLLNALGTLYVNDQYGLILEFWCPSGKPFLALYWKQLYDWLKCSENHTTFLEANSGNIFYCVLKGTLPKFQKWPCHKSLRVVKYTSKYSEN